MNRNYLVAGAFLITFGTAMVAGKLLAFDAIMALVVRLLSPDQVITSVGNAMLAGYWNATTTVSLLLGVLLSACSIDRVRGTLAQWIGRDALAESNPEMPRPLRVLLWSTLCGLVIVVLYLIHSHLGIKIPLLFKKEGLLEDLTFVLYLLSAVACAIAALSTQRNPQIEHHRLVAVSYLACAVAFFLIAGEEISWGQRILGIKTPEILATLNYQHEITAHNLMPKSSLDALTKGINAAFLLGLIALWVLGATLRMPVLQYVMPHPSLVGLALITFYSGLMLHLEIFEALLAIFITYYSYRVYKIAVHRHRSPAAPFSPACRRHHNAV